ncbi:MAG: class I SAM-dependent methyltransferase [Bryobacterales bacterium]|nr:class I SAM-dependent methyltransferase [Bryobacterales bacterium]MBV9397675.1 class I SAM-dependent methyltransferase [Bryobacterales bacterium]
MEQSWQVKCVIDTLKRGLPFQEHLRRFKDRVIGYQREPKKDAQTIQDGIRIIQWLGEIAGCKVLEIGTGWQPMIPILYSLAGASRIYTVDLHRLMRPETFAAALDAIRENRDQIADGISTTSDAVNWATRQCSDVAQRLEELRITYLSPCDSRRLPLESGYIDIVTSRAVLEHIPPAVIGDIFAESRRVLRKGGVMLHLVDHSDHWSHRDRRINAVNFLQYPDWLFRFTCINPQNYQNRLRHPEYIEMMRAAGFVPEREEKSIDSNCLSVLPQMRVAGKFVHFTHEDLATTSSIVLARTSSACARTQTSNLN